MTHEDTNGETPKLSWPVVAQIIGWLAAALVTYGAVNSRVSVVESKQNETEKRLDRIEGKIDRVWDRVK